LLTKTRTALGKERAKAAQKNGPDQNEVSLSVCGDLITIRAGIVPPSIARSLDRSAFDPLFFDLCRPSAAFCFFGVNSKRKRRTYQKYKLRGTHAAKTSALSKPIASSNRRRNLKLWHRLLNGINSLRGKRYV
jgi:hypothetical protein